MQGAWKVGLLVVVFVGLLFGAYAVLGKSLFAPKTDTYYAEFDDASGLVKGGAVVIAGVKVGTIEEIRLTESGTARAKLAIDEGKRLPEGSYAMIQGQLIGFGDVPLSIELPAERTAFLEIGTTLQGKRGSPIESMFPEFRATANELNKTLVAARELISDEKLKSGLTKLMDTANATAEKFGSLATQASSMLADNRSAIKGAMASLSSTMHDVQEATKIALKLLKDDKWKKEAETLLASLNTTAGKAQELLASMNDLVNDPKWRDPLASTAQNIQSITDSGTRIAANTEEMTKHGIEISKNVEEVTKKASDLADEAKELLHRLQNFFNKGPSAGGLKLVETQMDLLHQSSPNHWRTDFTASFPFSGGRVFAGVYDAFEDNKLTIQYGKDVSKALGYRYGVYASKPGVGVDFHLASRWDLRGDFYDINNPTMDFRTRFDLGNGWHGWLGLDKAFDKNALTAGLGIRK